MPLLIRHDWLRSSALAVVLAANGPCASQLWASPASETVDQQSVYAAFVVNITRFIQWPDAVFAQPDSPLVIGTFPKDPINEFLDAAVVGESAATHPLKTMRIQNLDDLSRCNVVYITGSAAVKQSVLARIANKPILSVSDDKGFIELGGHVRFVPRPPHTQLRIGVANLRASGLQARAQLLRLAQLDGS